jgi:hypothetical protein
VYLRSAGEVCSQYTCVKASMLEGDLGSHSNVVPQVQKSGWSDNEMRGYTSFPPDNAT